MASVPPTQAWQAKLLETELEQGEAACHDLLGLGRRGTAGADAFLLRGERCSETANVLVRRVLT